MTIIPRGRALGVTAYAPLEERHNRSKKQLEDRLAFGHGRSRRGVLVFDHLTTGAIGDLESATALARNMVTRFGMSEKLGPLTFGKREDMVFLGREISTSKDYSEHTAVLIDSEVRDMVERGHARALSLLRENMDKLHLLANTLLERESLDGDQMDRVLKGEKLEPFQRQPDGDAAGPEAPPVAAKQGDDPQMDAFGSPAPRPA